jgi:pyridoxal/pyridoxine/pyridoxamine kinase
VILISDNHEHIVKDPKHITVQEVEGSGFIIKADNVIMGFFRSHRTALTAMECIADALRADHPHQVISSYE